MTQAVTLDDLSALQRAVATAPPSRLVFIGGTGAGKTRLLGARAAWLIASGRVRPQEVLILAPSRRAASAVAEEACRRLGWGVVPAALSFHGLAVALVCRHFRALGYGRPPTILGSARLYFALRQMLAAEKIADWPRHGNRLDGEALRVLAYDTVTGAAANGLDEAELLRRGEAATATPLRELAGFYGRYLQHLRHSEQTTYDEALRQAVELLATQPEAAAECHRLYRHILVDEFEDASYTQCEFLCRLVGPETDLLVAGDPEQAIAAYRGGSPSYLDALSARLGARVVTSDENHRAAPRLAALGRAVRGAGRSTAAALQPAGDDCADGTPGTVVLRPFAYPADEARWVAVAIAGLLREGIAPREAAIIVRSLGQPIVPLIEAELRRRAVPFHREAAAADVQDPLVRAAFDVLCYLAGGEGAVGALKRILDSPLAGLPPFGLAELRRAVAAAGRDLAHLSLAELAQLPLSESVGTALRTLHERLAILAAKAGHGMGGLLWEIWRLFPAFAADVRRGGTASRAYGALLAAVAELEEAGRTSLTLADLLDRWQRGDFARLGVPGDGARGVAITTVHMAKGREWEAVFLPGLCEGDFPLKRSPLDVVSPLLARDLPLGKGADDLLPLVEDRRLAEEKRAFQVAIGRARRQLYLSYSRYGPDGTSAALPSRFLDGLADQPYVTVAAGDGSEQLPPDVPGAVAFYRRLLRDQSPLRRAQGLYALHRLQQLWPEAVQPALWWENVRETTGAASPFPNARLHLSASRLGAYRSCPLAYQYAYHWQLYEPSGAAATVGNVLHKVLEEYHRPHAGLPRSRETLQELLEKHFDAGAFAYRPLARQAKRNLEAMLDSYYQRYGQDGPALAVEGGFAFAHGRHVITGYIDRIDRLASGQLEIIDYKTGSPMTKADAEGDLQLAIYDLACYEDAALRALGRPVKVSYLYLKAIRPRSDGKRSYAPSDEGRAYLRQRIDYYAAAILAERFPSFFELAEAFSDLDPAELARILAKEPCRVCAFLWLCPQQEKGAGYD